MHYCGSERHSFLFSEVTHTALIALTLFPVLMQSSMSQIKWPTYTRTEKLTVTLITSAVCASLERPGSDLYEIPLTPTQPFLVYSGRSAKQRSCPPLFSLHSDTSGEGHQSFVALALHCVPYTPETKHHRKNKENAKTHRAKYVGRNLNQLLYGASQTPLQVRPL